VATKSAISPSFFSEAFHSRSNASSRFAGNTTPVAIANLSPGALPLSSCREKTPIGWRLWNPTLRKERERMGHPHYGTTGFRSSAGCAECRGGRDNPHFSQRMREMGHPANGKRVPHRAWRPVRNDKELSVYFRGAVLRCGNRPGPVGDAETAWLALLRRRYFPSDQNSH
jgi:hypothetical protein